MGRALEHVQVFDVRREGGNDLRRAGAAADDGDPFVAIVVGMIPGIAVKTLARKALQTLERRNHRLAQRPGCVDQELCAERAFVPGMNLPLTGRFVPLDPIHIGLQFDPVA
ncbi:hypothetical protein D3C85_790260 [compost metagenome]